MTFPAELLSTPLGLGIAMAIAVVLVLVGVMGLATERRIGGVILVVLGAYIVAGIGGTISPEPPEAPQTQTQVQHDAADRND